LDGSVQLRATGAGPTSRVPDPPRRHSSQQSGRQRPRYVHRFLVRGGSRSLGTAVERTAPAPESDPLFSRPQGRAWAGGFPRSDEGTAPRDHAKRFSLAISGGPHPIASPAISTVGRPGGLLAPHPMTPAALVRVGRTDTGAGGTPQLGVRLSLSIYFAGTRSTGQCPAPAAATPTSRGRRYRNSG